MLDGATDAGRSTKITGEIGIRGWERERNKEGITFDATGARNSNNVGVEVGSDGPGVTLVQGDGPNENSTALQQSLTVGLSIYHDV